MQIITGKIKSAQKVCIYGPEGIGKSTFASKFPQPIFIDTEGSTKHMDVARTPTPSSWTMLMEQIKYFKSNPNLCKTLVIDTADWAEQLCMTEICAKHQKKSIEDFGYGKGYVYLAEEFGRMLNLLEELVGIGINIVITAHAKMRKFEQPDELGTYDRWEMKLQKQTAPLLKEWADMVLFANYKTHVINVDNQGAEKGKNKARGGKRVMYTTHHPCWDAKNRHDLQPELPFEYESISHCIEKLDVNKSSAVPDPVAVVAKTAISEVAANVLDTQIEEDESPVNNTYSQYSADIPKDLLDLMTENNVTEQEVQDVVALRGYYPANTPIANFDANFISGVLVGAWPQVFEMIKTNRNSELPFN